MRNKLCFNCKDPWVLSYRCMGKGQIHYIEVAADNDEEEQCSQVQDSDSTSSEEEPLHEEEDSKETNGTGRGTASWED
jgi:hypothetical protein